MTATREAPSHDEMYVVAMVSMGEPLVVIAEVLGVSERTVRRWVDNMRRRYCCDSRAALVALALREGWIR